MVLLSKVEKSSEEIMEIMQNLSSIQALEGSRELENLLGISRASCFLREMQKTKELMTKATKQKLFEKKSSGLPNKDDAHQHMRMYRPQPSGSLSAASLPGWLSSFSVCQTPSCSFPKVSLGCHDLCEALPSSPRQSGTASSPRLLHPLPECAYVCRVGVALRVVTIWVQGLLGQQTVSSLPAA
ncbi:centromere protein R isoform X3 [Equus asinus]